VTDEAPDSKTQQLWDPNATPFDKNKTADAEDYPSELPDN